MARCAAAASDTAGPSGDWRELLARAASGRANIDAVLTRRTMSRPACIVHSRDEISSYKFGHTFTRHAVL
eukprot:6204505-Pleurochrysis_carterae.AAC.1